LEQEYSHQKQANPAGHRYHCDNAFINNDADIPSVLEKALTTSPSKETYAFWTPMSPWSQRDIADMAVSLRTDHYLALYTICKDEEDDIKCRNWADDVIKDVKKYFAGSYTGDIDFQVRTTRFWSEENGKRLMEIRRKWDPTGIICGYLDTGDKSGVDGLDNQLDQA
jgi:hypothetical protein